MKEHMCLYTSVLRLLTEAAELADDVGQGDVSHTFQLVLDVSWQHRVAQVPGLDGALHQRHPSAEKLLPDRGRGGQKKERIQNFSESILVINLLLLFITPSNIRGTENAVFTHTPTERTREMGCRMNMKKDTYRNGNNCGKGSQVIENAEK